MIRSLAKRARHALDILVGDDDPLIVRVQRDALASHAQDLTERLYEAEAEVRAQRGDLDRGALVEDQYGNVVARGPGASVEDEYVRQFHTEDELTSLRRRCDEYFKLIESIEKERNEWIELWRKSGGEHLTAQSMLERELGATRQTAARAIIMLNKMRVAQGLDPIDKPTKLEPYDGEPIGIAERYAERLLALRERLGAPIDAKSYRDASDERARSTED